MRVQVVERPRIASTSTSAGARCGQTSGWRSFQRARPAIASAWVAARPISMSGFDGIRRFDGATRGGSSIVFA